MTPMKRLDDRVALVIGAGQTPGETMGNGRATAVTFAREGARLVLVDRHEGSLAETADLARAEGAEVHTVVADIATDDGPDRAVAAAVEAFGGVDILHNNVGIGAGDGPPHHLEDAAYDRIMDVNLRAMWRTCRAAVPVLRASANGAIVNVSSLAAIGAAGNLTAYKLSKAGVNALTQNLALDEREARAPGQRHPPRVHRHPDGRRRPGPGTRHRTLDRGRRTRLDRPARTAGHRVGRRQCRALPRLG